MLLLSEEGLPQGGGHNVWQPQETRWLISVKTNPRFSSAIRHPRPSSCGAHLPGHMPGHVFLWIHGKRGRQKERKKSHPHNAHGVCGLRHTVVLKPKIFGRLRFFLFLLSLFFTLIFINIIRSCASSEYIYIYLFFFLLVKKFEKTKAMITLKHVMFVCFENTKPPIKGVKRFNAEFQFFFL